VAVLKNCELHFVKANPTRPNAKFNKANPTWEVQIRTTSKAVKKAWEDAKLAVKAVVPDEEGQAPYFRVNLRKKSIKESGEASSPVDVVDHQLKPIDPDSIGNGSIGNVRVFQYEYKKEGGGTGIANVLMGIQVTKHLVYVPKARTDDFSEEAGEVVEPAAHEEEDEAARY
jgi:hypothetical protein